MTKNNQPLMGKKQLIKSILLALLIGGIVLITAVLPAEYNIDPLGAGKLFGFSKLYTPPTPEIKEEIEAAPISFKKLTIEDIGSGPDVPPPAEINNPAPAEQYSMREDNEIKVLVKTGKGIEYKFKMLKYGQTKYEWSTDDGSILYNDMHGEVIIGGKAANPSFFESYTQAFSNNMVGTLTAPFEGIHGWYFRNKNKNDVTVTIKLKGQYELYDMNK